MRENLVKIGALVAAVGLALTGQGQDASSFFEPGKIAVGCNYWASHAGMHMWRDWNAAQVEKDLDLLAAQGITVIRVFPLWPDFQPLNRNLGWQSVRLGFLQGEGPLMNYAGVDDEMIRRFRFVCNAAGKRKIGVIVGLMTGWMSGRMFVPPAFLNENVITSPEAIMWQSRYVRYFVNATKDLPSIVAWDMGNECNYMAKATSAQMWVWFHALGSEIRRADPRRRILSGLHVVGSQECAQTNVYQMDELLDVVTTHPYPLWSANCNLEPFDSLRNGCHAPCETVYYADLSRKPGIVEEAGSLGPCVASEELAAATMRMQLFGSWAVGVPAYLWWCAFDQDKLEHVPYATSHVERELGLLTSSGAPKPTAAEIRRFAEFQKALPFDRLPPRRVDAVVLSTGNEDGWIAAQGAWLLAKQAGFDIAYARAEENLPESGFYILPSGQALESYSSMAWRRVMGKVEGGATLFVTLGNGSVLSELPKFTGVETVSFCQRPHELRFEIGGRELLFTEPRTRVVRVKGARVLVADGRGNPLMTEFSYGKGKVLFFNGAPETNAQLVGWPIYRLAAERAGVKRRVRTAAASVGLTEHPRTDGSAIVVAINYENASASVPLEVDGLVGRVWRGSCDGKTLQVAQCDAAVFEVLSKSEEVNQKGGTP